MEPGAQLGRYEIIELLGAGGMGSVYRARDAQLGRDVAIKVLPDEFAEDPDRLARFQREAQVLATLNHRNIAVIHELVLDGECKHLVLELVEGQTLAERLAEGPMDLDDTLAVCRQIAEALEEAHAHGIVHRDLKPENVLLTADGTAKVLDFGLAKPVEDKGPYSGSGQATSLPTSAWQSQTGVVMGTVLYMSPEQARGKPVDRRTDIWAFGCVLFRLLTNELPFAGETVSDALAAILTQEPDWQNVPDHVPARIRTLLQRCLTKDVRYRLRDIGDAWVEIDQVLSTPEAEHHATTAAPLRDSGDRRSGVVIGALAAAAVLVVGAAYVTWTWPSATPEPARTLSIMLPQTAPIETRRLGPADPVIAIAPDGSRVVYVANVGAVRRLAVRDMQNYTVSMIPGTDDAKQPFFSPNGDWIGFFAFGELQKVPVAGGAPVFIADAPSGWGGAWTPDGRIVFTPADGSGLFVVPDDGSAAPTPLTTLDAAAGEVAHDFPYLLPDGDSVLFSVFLDEGDEQVARVSLSGGAHELVIQHGGYPRYVPPGFLVYGRGDSLQAVPFDLTTGTLSGTPVAVLEGLLTDSGGYFPHFDISASGTLVYVPGGDGAYDVTLAWYSRQGQYLGDLIETPGRYSEPRLSPDGDKVALVRATQRGSQISVFDVDRGTFSDFRQEAAARWPQWSPDGTRLAFSMSAGEGPTNVYEMPADGSEPPHLLFPTARIRNLTSWAREGGWVAYRLGDPDTGDDVWVMRTDEGAQPIAVATTGFRESEGALSPDGRWVAYSSNESSRSEIYVRAVQGSGKWQISDGGGTEPVWSADGTELFFRNGREIVGVAVQTTPSFRPGPPAVLFTGPFAEGSPTFDVHPDGDRLLMLSGGERAARPVEIIVSTRWFDRVLRQLGTVGR